MTGILNSEEMSNLVTFVEEAARSTEEGVKHFVEPAPNTLRRATNKRHHVVFGRRGSGKSSLLRKAAADLTIDRRPIAHVNLEAFKGHSYPDVLISVLISTFGVFKNWMDSAAVHPSTRTTFWKKLFGTAPKRPSLNRKKAAELSKTLSDQIEILTMELHRTDDAELTLRAGSEAGEKDSVCAKTKLGMSGASAEANAAIEIDQRQKKEIEERFRRSKIDFLHRNIMEYQNLFRYLGEISGGDAYLFLDDLYHIRRADQAQVIDYFHRIAKGHNLWLKIGTIRHRTRWYSHGDPPIGMKLGDDGGKLGTGSYFPSLLYITCIIRLNDEKKKVINENTRYYKIKNWEIELGNWGRNWEIGDELRKLRIFRTELVNWGTISLTHISLTKIV